VILSADEFVRLRTSDIMDEYQRAALEEAPESIWLEVIDRHPEMRAWVAHNKTVPQSILRLLADDQDDDVRFTVAMKRKAEPAILDKLSRDPCEGVRERVAYNRKAPLWILERLTNDPVDRIAEAARSQIEERTVGR
jgi:hypothetical protein